MIKSVHLKNFQKHKDLKIDFTEGVNVLCAPTDWGKSAIVRSILWCAFNRPSGDSIKHWGAKFVEVTVETDEHTITRRKDSKFNGYILDGQEHAAVGLSVPEPVKNAFNFTEINAQSQFDLPFMLAASSGEVGKQLNELVDLSIIDTTISGINKRVKDHNKTISVLETVEKQQAEVLKKYKGIDKASSTLKDLRTAHNIYSGNLARSLKLEAILRQSYKYVESTKDKVVISNALTDMDAIAYFTLEIKSKNSMIISLQRLLERYNSALEQNQGIEEILAAIDSLNAISDANKGIVASRLQIKRLSDDINVYSEAQNRLVVLRYIPDALDALGLIVDLNRGVEKVDLRAKKLEQTIKRLQRAEESLKAKTEVEKAMEEEHKELFGENCPLCGSRVGSSVESCSGC